MSYRSNREKDKQKKIVTMLEQYVVAIAGRKCLLFTTKW